jgi:hypothetical protein
VSFSVFVSAMYFQPSLIMSVAGTYQGEVTYDYEAPSLALKYKTRVGVVGREALLKRI